MAVTKIRKFSSWVLLACTIILLVIVGLFFFGGDNEPYNGKWNPIHVDTMLYWMYALLGATLVIILFFVIAQFISNFKHDIRKALTGLAVLVLFAIMFFAAYSFGDGTPIASLANKADAAAYNTPFWLKLTDMFLYSIYIMATLTVLGVAVGSVKKVLGK